MALLREPADEFGYWPATTDEADIERHRRLNAALDRNYRPHRWDHLTAAHNKSGNTPEGTDDRKAPQLALPRVR